MTYHINVAGDLQSPHIGKVVKFSWRFPKSAIKAEITGLVLKVTHRIVEECLYTDLTLIEPDADVDDYWCRRNPKKFRISSDTAVHTAVEVRQ